MIKVYASASIGNVSVGFDVLGVAISPIDGIFLGDSISIESSSSFNLYVKGKFFHELPIKVEDNIVYQCWKYFCDFLGESLSLSICLEKNIPVSSGLGSSACSIVATLVAINSYCGSPLNKNQLLHLMAEMEGKVSGEVHYDNVAPCFLGGMQIVLGESDTITQNIPIFPNWLWIIAYPGVKISTLEARSVLPLKYYRYDCVAHSRYLSGFVHACHTGQESLAIKLMRDVISEPYRSKLLPGFFSIRERVEGIGGLMCGISGSGPTVFALSNNKKIAFQISRCLLDSYVRNTQGFVHVCCLNFSGVNILME